MPNFFTHLSAQSNGIDIDVRPLTPPLFASPDAYTSAPEEITPRYRSFAPLIRVAPTHLELADALEQTTDTEQTTGQTTDTKQATEQTTDTEQTPNQKRPLPGVLVTDRTRQQTDPTALLHIITKQASIVHPPTATNPPDKVEQREDTSSVVSMDTMSPSPSRPNSPTPSGNAENREPDGASREYRVLGSTATNPPDKVEQREDTSSVVSSDTMSPSPSRPNSPTPPGNAENRGPDGASRGRGHRVHGHDATRIIPAPNATNHLGEIEMFPSLSRPNSPTPPDNVENQGPDGAPRGRGHRVRGHDATRIISAPTATNHLGEVEQPAPPAVIQVRIGRVEVRTTPPAPRHASRSVTTPKPILTLDEYLQQRKRELQ